MAVYMSMCSANDGMGMFWGLIVGGCVTHTQS